MGPGMDGDQVRIGVAAGSPAATEADHFTPVMVTPWTN